MTRTLIALATCALLVGAAIPMPGHGPLPEAAGVAGLDSPIHDHAAVAGLNGLPTEDLLQIQGASDAKDLVCGYVAGMSLGVAVTMLALHPLAGVALGVASAACFVF